MTERVALVTGCGKPDGMGQAIVRRLVAEGVAVMATDIAPGGVPNRGQGDPDPTGISLLVDELTASGHRVASVLGDIADDADADGMVEATVARFGRLDILVNAAAAPQGEDRADIVDVPISTFDRIVAVNLRGTYLMCRAAVPHMRRQRYGRIVNIASMAGLEVLPHSTAYSASKAGVIGFTMALAADVGAWGITANCVCPGLVWTSRGKFGVAAPEEEAQQRRRMGAATVAGRVGVADDIAAAVAFLASEGSGYVTAQSLPVNGGGLSPFPLPGR